MKMNNFQNFFTTKTKAKLLIHVSRRKDYANLIYLMGNKFVYIIQAMEQNWSEESGLSQQEAHKKSFMVLFDG